MLEQTNRGETVSVEIFLLRETVGERERKTERERGRESERERKNFKKERKGERQGVDIAI